MIALVDYGAGNLTSVRKAFAALGADLTTPLAPRDLASARGIVVPGVGHFDRTTAIDDAWREAIRARVEAGVPLFGICLGLQWLFEGSTEAPSAAGLGVFPGLCEHIGSLFSKRDTEKRLPMSFKVPHVGWNSLTLPRPSALMAGIPDEAQVYFTHSYAAPTVAATAAVTTYGARFSAAVERDNVSAVQFHPEKSGEVGLRILENWLKTCGLGLRAWGSSKSSSQSP